MKINDADPFNPTLQFRRGTYSSQILNPRHTVTMLKLKTTSLLLALLLLLTGCGAVTAIKTRTAEVREAREVSRFEEARVLCLRYGFKPETEAFAQCLQNEVNQIKSREAIKRQTEEMQDALRTKPSK